MAGNSPSVDEDVPIAHIDLDSREGRTLPNPNAGAHAYRPEDKDDGPNTETQLSSVCGQTERAEREDTSDEKEEPAKDPTEAWRILDKKTG